MSKTIEKIKARGHAFTVGDLLDYIKENGIQRDALVLYHRIEDSYFKESIWHTGEIISGWDVVAKEGVAYHEALRWNARIDSGELLDKEQYPLLTETDLKKYSPEDLQVLKDQYVEVFTPCGYNDGQLYLSAHY